MSAVHGSWRNRALRLVPLSCALFCATSVLATPHVLRGGLSITLSLPSQGSPSVRIDPPAAVALQPSPALADEGVWSLPWFGGFGSTRLDLHWTTPFTVTHSRNPLFATGELGHPDTIFQFAPSMNLHVRGPVLSGHVNYVASALAFEHAAEDNTVFHTLRSNARLNLVRDRFMVDASAQYTQQALSAFGNPLLAGVGMGNAVVPGYSNAANRNVVDVMALQVAPVIRANLAGVADLEARYVRSHLENRTVGGAAQDAQTLQADLAGGSVLRWGAQAALQRQTFANGRSLEASRLLASLSLPMPGDLLLTVGAGGERQNLQTDAQNPSDQRNSRLLQAGLAWKPGPRTTATIEASDRYFGQAWQLGLSHRFDRLGLRLAASRNVSDGALNGVGAAGANREGASFSAAELYGQLLAVSEPDVMRRDAAVAQLLQSRGLNADARVVGLSQSLGPVIQDRAELGFAYVLPRQSVNLVLVRTASSSILRDPVFPTEDIARFGGVTQTILQAGVSHRLTPDATIALNVGRLRSEAAQGARPVQLQQAELHATYRVGARTTLAVVLRDAEIQNSNVTAATGSVSPARRDTSLSFQLIPQF